MTTNRSSNMTSHDDHLVSRTDELRGSGFGPDYNSRNITPILDQIRRDLELSWNGRFVPRGHREIRDLSIGDLRREAQKVGIALRGRYRYVSKEKRESVRPLYQYNKLLRAAIQSYD